MSASSVSFFSLLFPLIFVHLLPNSFIWTSSTRKPLFMLLECTKICKYNGSLSINGLKTIVAKFEKTDLLGSVNQNRKIFASEYNLRSCSGDWWLSTRQYFWHFQSGISRSSARSLNVHYSTVWKVLWKITQFNRYKISRVQELRHTGHDKRLTLALTFLAKMEVEDTWTVKILWGDEINLNEIVNTQNTRIRHNNSSIAFKEIPI